MTSPCGLCPGVQGRPRELGSGPFWRDNWGIGILLGYEVPGWLALFPRRHVVTSDEMTDDEAQSLGSALRRLTEGLKTYGNCDKVYSVAFGERIPHWHMLVMAIPETLPASMRGANILVQKNSMVDVPAAESIAAMAAVIFCDG